MSYRPVRRLSTLVGAAVLVGAMTTMNAGSAAAESISPGDLCTAKENINFFDDFAVRYTVSAGGGIRIVNVQGAPNYSAYGHGNGHTDLTFYYRHSNGEWRVEGCHQT